MIGEINESAILQKSSFRQSIQQKNNEGGNQNRKSSISLVDFDISRVISKNQPIDIKYQGNQIENFFIRLNDLGYDINQTPHETIMVNDNSHNGETSQYPSDKSFAIYGKNKPISFSRSEIFNQTSKSREKLIKQKLFQSKNRLLNIIRQLQKQKQQIIKDLSQLKQDSLKSINQILEEYCKLELKEANTQKQKKNRQIQNMQQLVLIQSNRIQELEEINQQQKKQIENNLSKIEQLLEISEDNKNLVSQIQLVQIQNSDLKFELHKKLEFESQIQILKKQIVNLNLTLQQNNEYIFDLEQKSANINIQLEQRQMAMKQKLQLELIQEKQKLKKHFSEQFEQIKKMIEQKVRIQMQEQKSTEMNSIVTSYQKQLKNLQNKYKQQIQYLKRLKQNKQIKGQLKLIERQKTFLPKTNRKAQRYSFSKHKKQNQANKDYQQKITQFQCNKQQMLFNFYPNFFLKKQLTPSYHNFFERNTLDKIKFKPQTSKYKHQDTSTYYINNCGYQKQNFVNLNHSYEFDSLQNQKIMRMKSISQKLSVLRRNIRSQIDHLNI